MARRPRPRLPAPDSWPVFPDADPLNQDWTKAKPDAGYAWSEAEIAALGSKDELRKLPAFILPHLLGTERGAMAHVWDDEDGARGEASGGGQKGEV